MLYIKLILPNLKTVDVCPVVGRGYKLLSCPVPFIGSAD